MNSAPVGRFLRGTGRRALAVRAAHTLGIAATAFIAVFAAAVILDALFGFAPSVLVTLDAAIIAALACGLIAVLRQFFRQRFDARRLAILAERGLGIGDNALINAVELAGAPRGGMSAALADLAVHAGEEAIATRRAGQAIDPRPALRALFTAAISVLCLLAAWAVFPRVFSAVVPRLVSPHADLPPFTLLRFDIKTEPQRVIFGRPAQVLVSLSGPVIPETADIIMDEGPTAGPASSRTRTAMMRSGDGFAFKLDRAQTSRRFCIDTAQGRSAWQTLVVYPVPTAERVTLRLGYPSYTRWPSDEAQLGLLPITALEGTRVTVTLKSSLPLKSVDLSLSPDGAAPGSVGAIRVDLIPRPEDPTVAEGSFTLSMTGNCRMDLLGADGTPGDEPVEGRFVMVRDDKPRVAIADPGPVILAPEGWKVPITVAARDDVGIAKATLRSGLNRLESAPTDLPLSHPGAPYTTAEHEFDLGAMGAKDGDTVWYYASATDAKPGPDRFTDTPSQTIQVISMEKYKELAREQYGIEEMTEELARFLEEIDRLAAERKALTEEAQKLAEATKQAADSGQPLSPEDREGLRQLADHLQRNAEQSRQLARALKDRAEAPTLYDFEETYKNMLREQASAQENMASTQSDLSAAAQQSADSPQPSTEQAQQLQDLAQQLADAQQQADQNSPTQQTQEDLERLRQASAMADQASRLSEIIKQQREVAEKLGQYRDSQELSPEDRERAAQLAQQQTQLKDDLANTREQLQKLAEEAKDSLPKMSQSAQEICDAIGEMDVAADQTQAAQSAQAGDGPPAHTAADSAADKLESLQSQCNGMCDNPSPDLDGALSLSQPQLQQAMQQLAARRPGQRPGSRPGQGQGSGQGAGGQQSQVSLMGPHMGSDRLARAQSGRGRKDAPPQPLIPGEDGQGGRVERLDPNSAAARGRGTSLQGVPARYRDEAEIYFRRLSEDADRTGGRR